MPRVISMATPLQMLIVPRVAIKAVMPRMEIRNPLKKPSVKPKARAVTQDKNVELPATSIFGRDDAR